MPSVTKKKVVPPRHRDRLAGMVGEHEHGVVVRRVLTPPSPPGAVTPVAPDGSEHVAAHDRGTDAAIAPLDEVGVDGVVLLARGVEPVPLPEAADGEDPLVEALAADAERVFKALVRSRDVAVERHREVVDTEPGHGRSCQDRMLDRQIRAPVVSKYPPMRPNGVSCSGFSSRPPSSTSRAAVASTSSQPR